MGQAATSVFYEAMASRIAGPRDRPRVVTKSSAPARSAADDARLRALVQANFAFVWRAVRGLGVPASSADDAAQNVFVIASQKLSLIAFGSERSFLFATARGVAANFRRLRAHNEETSDDEALENRRDVALDPEQQLAKDQSLRLLERLLDDLAEDLKTVFVLFELEGMTTVEIAELLELPMGTVASKLRRAREDFQTATKRYQASMRGRS